MDRISENAPVFIIAEAGVNHNGSIELAKQLIDVASEAGADAVKFQTFVAEEGVSKNAPKAEYQKHTTDSSESQLEMVKKLELSKADHKELMNYTKQKKIMFLSTPFDNGSVDLLIELGVPLIKISSGEITNHPFLKYIAKNGRPIILSTGTIFTASRAASACLDVTTPVKETCQPRSRTASACSAEYPKQ